MATHGGESREDEQYNGSIEATTKVLTNAADIRAFLPSKQTTLERPVSSLDRSKSTLRRRKTKTTKSVRSLRPPSFLANENGGVHMDDVDLEITPAEDDDDIDEEETWLCLQQIKSLTGSLEDKRHLRISLAILEDILGNQTFCHLSGYSVAIMAEIDQSMLDVLKDLDEALDKFDSDSEELVTDETESKTNPEDSRSTTQHSVHSYVNAMYREISDDEASLPSANTTSTTDLLISDKRSSIPLELNDRILPSGSIRWRRSVGISWGIRGARESLQQCESYSEIETVIKVIDEKDGHKKDISTQPQTFADIYAKVRREKTKVISTPATKLTGYKKWKYERAKNWKVLEQQWREVLTDWEVWKGSIKKIEGNFGSAVVSYFRFLKWLFWLNLLLAVLILGVIIFPQELMAPKAFEDSVNETLRTNQFVVQALSCSMDYVEYLSNNTQNVAWYDPIFDFFQGTGFMENTILFYGYYFNKTFEWSSESMETQYYNMPLAYILSIIIYLIISLFLMVRNTGEGVHESLTNQGDKFYQTCNKVFCGWDYNLTKEKNADLRQKNIHREFESDLAEQRRAEKLKAMRWHQKSGLLCKRMVINIFVLTILAASGYIIYYVSEKTKELTTGSFGRNVFLTLLIEFLPSFTITALNTVVPVIFQNIVAFENLSPDGELHVTIVRTVFLRLSSIAILVWTLSQQVLGCPEPRTCGNCDEVKCWETYVGQQFFKLVLFDFIAVIFVTFLVDFPRKLIVHRFQDYRVIKTVGPQEFVIPKHVLDLVYTQTLCWMGAVFCPLIPAITVVKLFCFFYAKKLTVLCNCIPSSKPYRTSRSNTFFLTVLLLSFVVIVIPVLYVITAVPPSQSCGPFRVYSREDFAMFGALTDAVKEGPSWLNLALTILSSWSFYVPVAAFLSLVIYYYSAKTSGNRILMENLKEELARAGKDKQFLLNQVRLALITGDIPQQ